MTSQNISAQPDWLELLDHTADTGILVRAPTLKELFSRAATGMFTLLTDIETVRPARAYDVELLARDRSSLLVNWLSELNYRHITRHLLFSRFDVVTLSSKRIAARVYGEPIDRERHIVHTEIKAATYHGLEFGREGKTWTVRIIFDL